jgi:hypothetical protein
LSIPDAIPTKPIVAPGLKAVKRLEFIFGAIRGRIQQIKLGSAKIAVALPD